MKHIPTLLFLLLASLTNYAQAPQLHWAQRTGGYDTTVTIGYVYVQDLKISQGSHIVSLGKHNGSVVDLDAGPGIDTFRGDGMYISKEDTAGNHSWARRMPIITGNCYPYQMAIDTGGNIYITGSFNGSTDLDPGPGTLIVGPTTSMDMFIAKYDPNGNILWGYAYGSIGGEQAYGICVDEPGNVYLTGEFNNTIDFDPGAGVYNMTSLNDDIFILKLTTHGSFVWAKSISGTDIKEGRDITMDNAGNIYVTGAFRGTADFDPGPGTLNLSALSVPVTEDAFVLKLDNNGSFIWAKNFAGSGGAYSSTDNITVDKNGNTIVSGVFMGSIDCDPGPGTSMLTASHQVDYFAAKLTPAGNLDWAKQFGCLQGANRHLWTSLRHTSDTFGNIYITGVFKDTADFDPGPGVHQLTTTWDSTSLTFDNGIFMLLLDPNGNYKWATEFEHGGLLNKGMAIEVDQARNIYTTGVFADTIDFDPGPGVTLLKSPYMIIDYGPSTYTLRFGQCMNTGSLYDTACRQYTLNGQTYTQSGSYAQLFTSSTACDSLVSLHLVVNNADTGFSQAGNVLTANAPGASYQWFDCTNQVPITGATQQQFTITASNTYALIVTQNGCTDTSACHPIFLSIKESTGATNGWHVYPNPAYDKLTIKPGNYKVRSGELVIYDYTGRVVQKQQLRMDDETEINIAALQPGVHFAEVTTSAGRTVQKFVKM